MLLEAQFTSKLITYTKLNTNFQEFHKIEHFGNDLAREKEKKENVYQNILNDKILSANDGLTNLNKLNEMELEELKIQFNDCINFSQKARENFLMCSELELDDTESQMYYDESKKLKSRINEIKRIIKDINKKLDESE